MARLRIYKGNQIKSKHSPRLKISEKQRIILFYQPFASYIKSNHISNCKRRFTVPHLNTDWAQHCLTSVIK